MDCSKSNTKENDLASQIQVSLMCCSAFVSVCFSYNYEDFYCLRNDMLGCHSLYQIYAKQLVITGENLWRKFSPYKLP